MQRAFTLLELMTVIAIIAILMALLFPSMQMAQDAARRAEAHTTSINIVSSVQAYVTEYGKFPAIDAPAGQDAVVGDTTQVPSVTTNNSALFYTLRAIAAGPNSDNSLNPRKLPFFQTTLVKNPAVPKNGFLDNPANTSDPRKGCFFDPWGSQYFVVMDTNYDNQIDVSSFYTDFALPDKAPQVNVGVFSLGRDLQVGSPNLPGLPANTYRSGNTVSDDVVSWQ